MSVENAIREIELLMGNPEEGLSEPLFEFISTISPLINVDLMIKNNSEQVLLTWRDDGFHPRGWHVPGGIIRYKEAIDDRIQAVAKSELGVDVVIEDSCPIIVNEFILPQSIRGHFISMLYKCTLIGPPDYDRRYILHSPQNGQWMWHDSFPDNTLKCHKIYEKYL